MNLKFKSVIVILSIFKNNDRIKHVPIKTLLSAIILTASCMAKTNKTVEVKEQKVNIGDYALNYKDSGKGKHTIVLESGLGMDSETWTDIQNKLSKNYRVISYDRSGYGKSDNSKSPRTIDHITKDLNLLLETIDASTPYILVGHSLGGYVIRHFANLYPEKVSGLVMIDSYHEDLFKMLKDSVSISDWNKYLMVRPANRDTLQGFDSERFEFMETVMSDSKFKIPTKIPVHILTSLEPPEDTSRFVNVTMDLHEKLSLSFVTENENVNQTFTKSSGHLIYLDEPELVFNAVVNTVKRIERNKQ